MSRARLDGASARTVAVLLWLLSCSSQLVGAQKAKGASVSLVAKWPGTPLLLEAAEFVADQDQSALWSLVDGWSEPQSSGQDACWAAIQNAAGQQVSPGLAQVLHQALGSRQLSAKVAMLQSLADTSQTQGSCCMTHLHSKQFTTAQDLAAALKTIDQPQASSQAPEIYDFDHIYSSDAAASFKLWQAGNATAAVLYATPGTQCFQDMHKLLKDAMTAQHEQGRRPLVYALRPVLLKGCNAIQGCAQLGTAQPLQLAGYGVEMAIKNMEYSALDDSQVAAAKQAQQEQGTLAGVEEEVNGFLMGRLLERKPQLEQELLTFRDHLLASSTSSSDDIKLKVWDLKDLGLQASQRIAQASNPLRLLTDISHNFPTLASSLSRLPVNASLAEEVRSNQRSVPPGMNMMLLNGLPVDGAGLELYPLLDKIAAEVRLADQLATIGLQPQEAQGLLQLRAQAVPLDSSSIRIDLAPYQHVSWLNDLEKDRKRYRGFSRSVRDLLVPSFPGSLPSVARNLFNAVFVVDLASLQGLRVAEAAVRAINSRWPIRIGILPLVPDLTAHSPGHTSVDPSTQAATALTVLGSSFGTKGSLAFLTNLATDSASQSLAGDLLGSLVTLQQVQDAFTSAWQSVSAQVYGPSVSADELELAQLDPQDAWQQVIEGSGVAAGVQGTLLLGSQLALTKGLVAKSSQEGALWLNGLVFGGIPGGPQTALMRGVSEEMRTLQEHVYFRNIADETPDILAELLRLEGALPRYNPRILEQPSSDDRQDVRQMSLLGSGLNDKEGWLANLGYLYPTGQEDSITAITHWICIDPESHSGQGLLLSALQHISAESAEGADRSMASRIGIIHNPTDASQEPSLLARLLLATTQLTSRRTKIAGYLISLLSDSDRLAHLKTSLNPALELAQQSGLNLQALANALDSAQDSAAQATLTAQAKLAQDHLRLPPGSNAVVTNGRVVVVQSESFVDDAFTFEDFGLLDMYANSQQSAAGVQALLEAALNEGRALANSPATPAPAEDPPEEEQEAELTIDQLSNAAALASSILASHGSAEVTDRTRMSIQQFATLQGDHCAVTGAGLLTGSSQLAVQAVLNPLSKAAQRMAPVLEWLRSSFNADIKVYLNPERELSDMPLKTFYRYVLPEVSTSGEAPPPPAAVFKSLPPRQTLTLNFDAPEMWLVEPVVAQHDLDNLRLEQLDAAMLHAEFELEALMLTGRCIDMQAKRRDLMMPRGVQLHLGNSNEPHLQDTLVMSNLGYFQLKAAPGAWTLQLAPGRSRELYYIQDSTAAGGRSATSKVKGAAAQDSVQTAVAISSLQGKDMLLRITKRKGYEMDDVLEEPTAQDGSLWGRLTSWATKPNPLSEPNLGTGLQPKGGLGTALSPEDDPNTIHIFTVASGHMYERLQKIMILSVIRNTRNPVKFWFIKNYMSPQMKRFVPEMALQYNFHYQLVTYKWPSFLHKQTEKQRLIWAYKILFLDVLFPLNLRKVIFCDSDQVVRGDMAELWNMDLKGAPFGFTPFCDNNKDMEGFRFWKQGFWKEHLRGKPYHISALFVVDLARFRRTAAGDQLRMVYDQLSKDPNSLSNLDQDLPNYAQHSVPIFSLPMEWLWCETWCGNSTKEAAKTIDLCNNPLTKEPKLQGARRIVAEWPGLDEEARNFTQQLEAQLGTEAVALQGIEQVNSRDVDAAPSRQETDERLQGVSNNAKPVPNSLQDPAASRHDPSEL